MAYFYLLPAIRLKYVRLCREESGSKPSRSDTSGLGWRASSMGIDPEV
jgi:hypothetical protein